MNINHNYHDDDQDDHHLNEMDHDEDKEYGLHRSQLATSGQDVPSALAHGGAQAPQPTLWGRVYGDEVPLSEVTRMMYLSWTLFCITFGDSLFQTIQNPIFGAITGINWVIYAKILSTIVLFFVMLIYNGAIQSPSPKHELFYKLGMLYFVVFAGSGLLLMHPVIGALGHRAPDPFRILGWFCYCAIDNYAPIMINLFWSYTNSTASLGTAKASYGIVLAVAQAGNILGAAFVNRFASSVGIEACYLMGTMSVLFVQIAINSYVQLYGIHDVNVPPLPSSCCRKCCGSWEGLCLLVKNYYVQGIFVMSSLFLVHISVLEHTLIYTAKDHFAHLHPCVRGMKCYNPYNGLHGMTKSAIVSYAQFSAKISQWTGSVYLLLSLFGTSTVIRKFGVRASLCIFPLLCLLVSFILLLFPPNLKMMVLCTILLRGASYALNNPLKEILYLPTSPMIRFKARSWIETFGVKLGNHFGFVVTYKLGGIAAFAMSARHLSTRGGLVGIVAAVVMWCVARAMGRAFDGYMAAGCSVGGWEEQQQSQYRNVTQSDYEDHSLVADDSPLPLSGGENGISTRAHYHDNNDDDNNERLS